MQQCGNGAGSPSHVHVTQFVVDLQVPRPGQEHCSGVPPQSIVALQAAKTVVVESNITNERAALANPNDAKIQLICLLIVIASSAEVSRQGTGEWEINEHARKQRLVRIQTLSRTAAEYYQARGKSNPPSDVVNPKLKCHPNAQGAKLSAALGPAWRLASEWEIILTNPSQVSSLLKSYGSRLLFPAHVSGL